MISPLAALLAEWHRTAPAYRTQLLLDTVTQTPGSRLTFPGNADAQRGWIIHLHGVTGTGRTSTEAMADWEAGAHQAVERGSLRRPRSHGEDIADLLHEARP
ncbi:hypothetical protein [Pseudotabrizicola sp. 4114]|uniref:hypothetical protein n=1 Tax=Pseudotabrizicola sp. 4114 TaxID=2817731 RepID=UPI00285D7FB2|nr:hypothetical protein [Pseudorhodobacter sp. 4114]